MTRSSLRQAQQYRRMYLSSSRTAPAAWRSRPAVPRGRRLSGCFKAWAPMASFLHRNAWVFCADAVIYVWLSWYSLGHPTYLSADLGFTAILSFFLLLLIFRHLPSEVPNSLNGTQLKSATCSEVSAIWKCMSEMWGKPFPYRSGAHKQRLFDDFAT